MCGIFGVINTNEKIDEGRVLAARDVLAHRGPDDSGLYTTCTHASLHPNVFLAHRRLSIIDLSPAAHQPMISQDGRYTIVYNGEIYNYKSLIPGPFPKEKSLIPGPSPKEKGDLKSASDTEVILHLYAEYGKECLSILRGMFAFAIWDDKEKTLFAARDRFGIKPFYYYFNESDPPNGEASFIFSSELKAIKYYKGNLTINDDALDAFLRTGSVPAPMTIYNEVAALLPGHYLQMHNLASRQAGAQCTMYNYWNFSDLFKESSVYSPQSSINAIEMDSRLSADKAGLRENDLQEINGDKRNVISTTPMNRGRRNLKGNKISQSPDKSGSFEMTNDSDNSLRGAARLPARQERRSNLKYNDEAKKKIREALLDTIKAHMVADVEVGAFLSGGIDSTAIVSLMRQIGKEKIKTISIVFPGNKLDESKYARLAAKTYNTEHIEIPFYEKDLLDDFENIMSVMDQPTIDGINTYFVSKAAKSFGLKVVLSGLGGDELFGGYPSFTQIPKYHKIKSLPFFNFAVKCALPFVKNKLPGKALRFMKDPARLNSEYILMRGLFTDDELKNLGWNYDFKHPFEIDTMERNAKHNYNDNYPVFNLNDFPLQYVSELETNHYMRNQLLRDSDVFSMANSLELRVPFVDHILYAEVLPYLHSGFNKQFSKMMLVNAVGNLPNVISNRLKMGFTFPFEIWIKTGKLSGIIRDTLLDKKQNDLFSADAGQKLLKQFDEGRIRWSRLWALFILSRIKN